MNLTLFPNRVQQNTLSYQILIKQSFLFVMILDTLIFKREYFDRMMYVISYYVSLFNSELTLATLMHLFKMIYQVNSTEVPKLNKINSLHEVLLYNFEVFDTITNNFFPAIPIDILQTKKYG